MLVKKLLIMVAVAVTLCGCCSKNSYNLVMLGDIHYDRTDLHDHNVYKNFNPDVPWAQGVLNKEGLFSWRSQTLWVTRNRGEDLRTVPKNVKMWKKDIPMLLDNAAAAARKNNALYLFQLGDMVQGDAGTYKLHKEMLAGGLNSMTSRFSCPVLNALGNHDTRGPGGPQAWQDIVIAHYDKTVKNIRRKNSNFYFKLQGDIYYFHDLLNPDMAFLEEAVNTPSRYFFFVSHVPVVPAEESWIRNILSDDTERILELLLKRDAIVLSGHTHTMAISRYQPVKYKNTITQFVLNSTLRTPAKQKNFTPQVIFSNNPSKINAKGRELWKKLFAGKIDVSLLTHGSGYAVLRVSDDGVFVDFHNIGKAPVTFTLKKVK